MLRVLPFIAALFVIISCTKEEPKQEEPATLIPTKTQLKVFKDGNIYEEYEYDLDGNILSSKEYYARSSDKYYQCEYVYVADRISHVIWTSVNGSSIFSEEIRYSYGSENKLVEVNRFSLEGEFLDLVAWLDYDSDGKLIAWGDDMFYRTDFYYTDDQLTSVGELGFSGRVKTISIEVDDQVNPFYNFWPIPNFNWRFLLPNNLTSHRSSKQIEIQDPEDPTGTIFITEVEELDYLYEYNSEGLPIKVEEKNLVNDLTTIYTYEYVDM